MKFKILDELSIALKIPKFITKFLKKRGMLNKTSYTFVRTFHQTRKIRVGRFRDAINQLVGFDLVPFWSTVVFFNIRMNIFPLCAIALGAYVAIKTGCWLFSGVKYLAGVDASCVPKELPRE